MVIRIWLHRVKGNEFGWNAESLRFIGFATWAPTEHEVLGRVPAKLQEYLTWLQRQGFPTPEFQAEIEVVQRVVGDEVLFDADFAPAPADMIAETIQLMHAARSDLLATIGPLSDELLDWDPPYRNFAPWADWRTIREILVHVANTETRYYLPAIGYEPTISRVRPTDDWRKFL